MTDFEMDKMYAITGREFLALLSLIPDGTEKAKAIVENVAGREKSGKVNESQIDFLKPCPFCGSTRIRFAYHSKHWVVCEKCGGSSGMYPSDEEAALMWNRRARP